MRGADLRRKGRSSLIIVAVSESAHDECRLLTLPKRRFVLVPYPIQMPHTDWNWPIALLADTSATRANEAVSV
jgi:hypothetical protein